MSSDLWREFGGGEGNGANPWVETLITEPTAVDVLEEDDFGDFQEPVSIPSFGTPGNLPVASSMNEVKAQQLPSPIRQSNSQTPQRHERVKSTNSLQVPETPSPFQTPNNPSMARAFGHGDSASPRSTRSRPVPARETSSESTGLVVQAEDEEWADFPTTNDGPPQSVSTISSAPAIAHSRSASSGNTKASLNDSLEKKEAQVFKRPKYVPPPSVLISQFILLIQELPDRVESAMQRWRAAGGETSDLEHALRKCIAALRVAARVIAGRKSRWIRDTTLAQSMRIGQAQGAKAGGMKLTGVDKVEAQRENNQTAEFVRVWKQRLGAIRVALSHVTLQANDKPLVLPEISETMLVGSSKGSTPVMNDRTNCCLCGLKREERVLKVDVDVWDTSGEWWSSLWGHTDCRIFWEEHGDFLLQG